MKKSSYYFAAFLPYADGSFTALVPDVPELVTQGRDMSETMDMAEESLKEVLEDYVQEGRAIPAPSSLSKAKAFIEDFLARHGREDLAGEVLFPLVRVPNVDNTPVRISMSLPRCAIEALDAKARQAGKTRSGYVASLAMN